MTQIADEATIESGLPPLWAALRTFSGLIAVLAVGAIVAANSLIGNSPPHAVPVPPAVAAETFHSAEPAGDQKVASLLKTPSYRLLVFYLVAATEQAEVADWGEQVGAHEALKAGHTWRDRSYEILFARDPEEESIAGAAILERILAARAGAALVQVIDLRDVRASP